MFTSSSSNQELSSVTYPAEETGSIIATAVFQASSESSAFQASSESSASQPSSGLGSSYFTSWMVKVYNSFSTLRSGSQEEQKVDSDIDNQVLLRIDGSSSVHLSNSVQNTITAYPAVQYVASKIVGYNLPNIGTGYNIAAHIGFAFYKAGYVNSAYNQYEKALNYKTMFSHILPTGIYLAKLGFSELILKPILETSSKLSNEGQLCSAHAVSQFGVDTLGYAAEKFIVGSANPITMLYGTAHTAITCAGKDNIEPSANVKTTSSVVSIFTGMGIALYSYLTLDRDYTRFDVYNNILKALVGTAVSHQLSNNIATAISMSENFYNNTETNTCVTGEGSSCLADDSL